MASSLLVRAAQQMEESLVDLQLGRMRTKAKKLEKMEGILKKQRKTLEKLNPEKKSQEKPVEPKRKRANLESECQTKLYFFYSDPEATN